jgi:hypothetical protein
VGSSTGEAPVNAALIFNHHALPFDAADSVHLEMVNFLKICYGARSIGYRVIFVDECVDKTWFRLELMHGYFWKDWYDQHVNNPQYKDIIRSFRSIVTQQPFFTKKDTEEEVELFDVCLLNTRQSLSALRAAAWNKSPLLSFSTRLPWTASPIAITVEQLSDSGEIICSAEKLCNLYSVEQFEQEKAGLQKTLQDSIRSGQDILQQQETLYPRLCFCGKSPDQLRSWSYPRDVLSQIKGALAVLNTFAEHWHEGRVSGYTHKALRELGLENRVSGESNSVKVNSTYRQKRIFFLPTGEKILFENHIKFGRGIRMHFFANPKDRIVFIGYIGKHLPI